MISRAWLIAAFAVGIAVGICVEHLRKGPGAVAPSATVATGGNRPIGAQLAPPAPPASSTLTPIPSAPRMPQSAAPSASPAPLDPAAETDATEYLGYAQRIDVGPAFRKEVAAQSVPGNENHLGEAHRALEREVRDDSWSYPLEAEIQNSLVADTSMGNFKVEHLECRATMCEIRMSAQGGEQSAALSN